MTALDENFYEYMRAGKAVLFLGAGASKGAKSRDGKPIPDGAELGIKIANKFLGGKFADRDFKAICDFASNRKSVRELQDFLYEELQQYYPAPFHSLVPQFIWGGIATTNFDLIVERTFADSSQGMQRLVPYRSDADIPPSGFNPDDLIYVKLHGCITEHQNVQPPLIATTDQIIDHNTGRAGQFQQFLEWAKSKTIVFAGYRADDNNLRVLLNQIVKEGEKRPRHYIIRPNVDTIEADYWEERRFRTISISFQQFLEEIDKNFPRHARPLARAAVATTRSSFSKFISASNRFESQALIRYLQTGCEHVNAETSALEGQASKFYSGFDLGWYPIQHNLDVSRSITRAILAEEIIGALEASPARLVAIKAHAGAGKSVILRRLAWDAAKDHGKLIFYLPRGGQLDIERFEEIFSLTNKTVFLVADNAGSFVSQIQRLLERAKAKRWPLHIICGERLNEWNVSCEPLEEELDRQYAFKYLSKGEIQALIEKLDEHDSLGHLKSLPPSERPKQLAEQFGRQLLVALHEATKNANFRDIVSNEYRRIVPAEARLLYLDICALNRFDIPVRAGLIARVHGIDFDEFKDRFFRPLEEVVEIKIDGRTGDYTYQARHPLIAEWVYSSSLVKVTERFDNAIRILAKLNPTYSYDREVLSRMTRASALSELFPDRVMGASIYERAIATWGETAPLFHQWGLYEMHKAGDAGGLDRAQRLVERALQLEPHNKAIQHSFSELALRRSRLATNHREREVWREEALSRAEDLITGSRSPYAFHTMAKAATDGVADALAKYEEQGDELASLALDDAIKQAEEILRKSLQRFPNDDRILTAEAELGNVLNNANRTLTALNKAFSQNPRSELVARRLAKVQRAKGDTDAARETLRVALGHNSGSTTLNFDMATILREAAHNADQISADAINYHYSRSYIPGDRNYEARFWHARQLWLMGDEPNSKRLFQELRNLKIAYGTKAKARGTILDGAGMPIRFNGQIASVLSGYGFIKVDSRQNQIYFSNEENEVARTFQPTQRVSFSIAFSLLGPQATDVQHLLI